MMDVKIVKDKYIRWFDQENLIYVKVIQYKKNEAQHKDEERD